MLDVTRRGFLSLGAAAGLLAALPQSEFGGLPTAKFIKQKLSIALPGGFVVDQITFIRDPLLGGTFGSMEYYKLGPTHVEVRGSIPQPLVGIVYAQMDGQLKKDWEFTLPHRNLYVKGDFYIQELLSPCDPSSLTEIRLISFGPVLIHCDNQELIL